MHRSSPPPGASRTPRTLIAVLLSLCLAAAVTACGDGLPLTDLGPDVDALNAAAAPKNPKVNGNGKGRVGSVEITPGEVDLAVGETAVLTATVLDRQGQPMEGMEVTWDVSDPTVAEVDGGIVRGRGAGAVRVTARTGPRSDQSTVRVSGGSEEEPPEGDTPPDEDPPEEDPPGGSDPAPPPSATEGIWIGADEIAALPTSGSAWNRLKSVADGSCGSPDLSDQDDGTNVCIMAKALVFARLGGSSYRSDVTSALRSIATSGRYSGRALALGRELIAYVIAADLIDLRSFDSSLDTQFRSKLRELLTTQTESGPDNLVECHEARPNNWGTHCGGSRAAVAAYLGDQAELDRVATVFRGWVGDRAEYSGFSYGDLDWQCDSSRPVGINPRGCTRSGHSLDGVLPDDQRRGGGFSWPPPKENYVYEGLQGALATAVILHRQGYDAFAWGDNALLRAFQWLHTQADYEASGDDTWQPHVINHYYNANFPAPTPSNPGKNVGWTDWTLR